jgi:16S rRNA (guanine966-N2)-methyltransferase
MRIIAGHLGGRKLAAFGNCASAAHLRTTTDRVREALFSALEGGRYGDPIEGAQVLDLFAGTGALGLEALSRGAAHVTFVENGRKSISLLQANIALLDAQGTRILKTDATRLPPAKTPATLVFLDPPYGKDLGQKALMAALASGWIAPGALIVWEEAAPMQAPAGFTIRDHRRYGDTHVSFLDASA